MENSGFANAKQLDIYLQFIAKATQIMASALLKNIDIMPDDQQKKLLKAVKALQIMENHKQQ